jgi:hypothetical protein
MNLITTFPINVISWRKKGGGYISFYSTLAEVTSEIIKFDLIMEPIDGPRFPESSWLMVEDAALKPLHKAIGVAQYHAQEGINTRGGNAALYLKVLENDCDVLRVKNMSEEGKMSEEEREKYPQKQAWIESTLLYPLLRGEDVKRWHAEPSSYIIVPNDPKTGDIYSERDLKISFPKTYEFLLKFKEQLKNRTHYGTSISKSKMPFYMLFQVNKESFSDFKYGIGIDASSRCW